MQWFEDEDFWRELYPFLFSAERFAAAPGEVDQILALTGFSGRAVLDLCCGPGRHSLELASRGFAVTGVDRSGFLLGRARERTLQAGTAVEYVESDMREFVRPSSFDLALSLFTSFGYFEEEGDNVRVLRNVHESLVAGGVMLIDVASKEKLARNWQSTLCFDLPGGERLINRPHVYDDWCRLRNEWIWIKDGRARTFELKHWVYSGRELRDMLLSAGFAKVSLFGNLAGAPYDLDAPRLVALARKSA